MALIKCKDQSELNAALKTRKPEDEVWIVGNGFFEIYDSSQVRAYDSSQVRAYDSSQVRAYGSSQVRAYGSSQVRAYDSSQVRAYDSSQVRAYDSSQVTAYGSSQVRAYDSSQVRAYDSSQVRAGKQVAVTIHGKYARVDGGVKIHYKASSNAKEWLDNYCLKANRGVVILYKALNEDFTSPHKMSYAPGATPKAPDWDGGRNECGGGLHFSPHPALALKFHPEAKKFVGCPVKASEIVVHKDATYPDKVKAPRVCAPCFEVDINGNRVGE